MSALATANNGVLLTSGSGVPSIGTATVAVGGTGNTTFTAYSVIAAGTTATGAFQNVSGVGTSGQVLTSNGASALPTWQAASGTFAPNTTINMQEDFLGNITSNAGSGTMSYQTSGTWSNSLTAEAAHPGMISNPAVSNVGTAAVQFGNGNPFIFTIGGGAMTLNFVFKLVTVSSATHRYNLVFGFGVPTSTNFILVSYQDNLNSGSWQLLTNDGSTTTVNSATAATTGWHNCQITINAAGTSVEGFMDGVSLGTSATHIPVGPGLGNPNLWIGGVTGATACALNSIFFDLFYFSQTLTSSR